MYLRVERRSVKLHQERRPVSLVDAGRRRVLAVVRRDATGQAHASVIPSVHCKHKHLSENTKNQRSNMVIW